MITISKLVSRNRFNQTLFTSFQSFKPSFMVSKIKFHQFGVNPDLEEHLHLIPEDNILSKFIIDDKPKTYQNIQPLIPNKNIKSSANNKIIKQPSKTINYKQILASNAHGSIITENYKSAQLCLSGMNYTNVSDDNVYKSILKFQPDCILVQARPQYFSPNFQVIKKNPQLQVFSDKLFVDQLNLGKVYNLKSKFTHEAIQSLQRKLFPRRGTKGGPTNPQTQTYFPFLNKQIVSEKPLVTSIYHSLKTSTPIYLSQIPQSVHREWICNTHTLMQLQQLFKITVKALPLYPGIKNLTPFQLAAYLFPDQILGINDKYMATIIQIMLALGFKRIMMFGGTAENEAVMEILRSNLHCDGEGNITPLINYLVAEKVKSNVIRDYDPLELVQKHILFDTLYHGREMKNIKLNEFKTTNKIIKHYANHEPKEMMMKFRFDMGMKYSYLMDDCIKQGELRKKKEFMREAIRM